MAWASIPVLTTALLLGHLQRNEAAAVERPTAEEIQAMKEAGVFEDRLKLAAALANNRLSPAMTQRARRKIHIASLEASRASAGGIGQRWRVGPAFAFPYEQPPELRSLGTVRTLTILVDFADERATTSLPGMTPDMVFENIYGGGTAAARDATPFESMNAYYRRASRNQVDVQGDVLGWYHFPKNRQDYQPRSGDLYAHNKAIFDMIAEALASYDQQHDFAQYDNDNDGDIDLVTILYAGPPTGWMSFWWAYRWSFFVTEASRKTFDGKELNQFVFQFIDTRAGGDFNPRTLIHEMGHAFGLPDYYDYDPGVPPNADGGLGGLDMMDKNWGNHNAFSRWLLDWIDPGTVGGGEGSIAVLTASGSTLDGTAAVAVFPNLVDSAAPSQELFLVENRCRLGNDGGSAPIPAEGLLIWHVDATPRADATDFLMNNSDTAHKLIRLVRANNADDFAHRELADEGVFYLPGNVFTPYSTPNSHDYAGRWTGVSITDVATPGEQVSVRVGVIPPVGPNGLAGVAPAAPPAPSEPTSFDARISAICGERPERIEGLRELEALQRDLQSAKPKDLIRAWENARVHGGLSPKNPTDRIVLRMILTQLAAKDGPAALKLLQSLPGDDFAIEVGSDVLQAWADNDPNGATTWYLADGREVLRTSPTLAPNRHFAQAIFRTLAVQDITQAAAELESIDEAAELFGAVEGVMAAAKLKDVGLESVDKELGLLKSNRESAQAILKLHAIVAGATEEIADPKKKLELESYIQRHMR